MQKIRSTFEIYVDNNYEMLVTGSLQLKHNQHGTNMGNKVSGNMTFQNGRQPVATKLDQTASHLTVV